MYFLFQFSTFLPTVVVSFDIPRPDNIRYLFGPGSPLLYAYI